MMALLALAVVAVIFAIIGLRGMAVMVPVIALFVTFVAIGWIPAWVAVVLMMLLFGLTMVVLKGKGGGSE
jgi:hypothetical protein